MGSALLALLGTSHKTQCKLFTFWLNFLLRMEKKNIYIYSICPIYHVEIVGINTENTLYESFMIVKYMQTMDRKITLQIWIKIAQRSVND